MLRAYDQYALKAFRFSAIDYLLKPIATDELKEAIYKIRSRQQPKIGTEQIDYLLHNLKQKDQKFNKIGLPLGSQIEFVEVNKIIRCKAEGNYCQVSIMDRNVILLSKTLKAMEQNLKEHNFIRVHNSHLINPRHVVSFERSEGGLLNMADGHMVHVTRFSKQEILDLLST